ncbi:hypothetical protein [Deinococcus soli (ex Cha et al. 2016)]|uniref:Endonuclease III n=1 Tax=Deinococcus soli (ex Cha et al. 2016) TaxID=1309411 RepID=A0A0F7JNE5_9DEIO|nr:hypothetical protein [Deinococcus soli (ex Cha et al. 2016)]AKH17926.1 hypothetical protein SY84_13865 [Deinococcus soli (ex Cha et al. 2016)]
MTDPLPAQLSAFIQTHGIRVDPDFSLHASGVHSVVNCVFSAQARFEVVVLPLLARLNDRLPEVPGLTFQAFVEDVDSLGVQAYAKEVLCNRQQLSGRLKVDVARDVAAFFVRHGVQTVGDFRLLDDETAEQLVLVELVQEVRGIGPTLAHYLLWLMGREDHVKVDSLLTRLFARIGDWQPRMGNDADRARITAAIRAVAAELGTTPARLDNALWQFESRPKEGK